MTAIHSYSTLLSLPLWTPGKKRPTYLRDKGRLINGGSLKTSPLRNKPGEQEKRRASGFHAGKEVNNYSPGMTVRTWSDFLSFGVSLAPSFHFCIMVSNYDENASQR